jgi:hypothetical protein
VRSSGFGGFRSFGPSRRFGSFNRPFVRGRFVRFGHRPFFVNDCFGFFGCSPFFGASVFVGTPFFPGYYPGYYPFYPDYYPPPPPAPVVYNNDGNDVALATAVQRLSDQVEDLRDEQRSSRAYPQPAEPGASTSAVQPASSTIFVFRDGRRLTAQNYAITGQALWIFTEHAAKRYTLAEIDRAATEQANAANGVEVHLPEAEKR